MYKLETSKIKCSLSYDETNKLIQLAGMLSGQTAAITSERCAIFFSNIEKTSIMCADATKEINTKNMVRHVIYTDVIIQVRVTSLITVVVMTLKRDV